jgi:hypothetical protein
VKGHSRQRSRSLPIVVRRWQRLIPIATLAVSLAASGAGAPAAASTELTDVEAEIRGFLQGVGETSTRQDLALKGILNRQSRYSSMHVGSALARTEITIGGDVSYSVRMLGMEAPAKSYEVESWLPRGTAVRILGFNPHATYVDFVLKRAHPPSGEPPFGGASTFERVDIRVRTESPPTAVLTLVGLGTLVELGGDLDRLVALDSELGELNASLDRLRTTPVASAAPRPRLESLRRTLQDAIRNRRDYGTLVRAAPNELGKLEAELRAVTIELGETPAQASAEVELSSSLAGLISHLAGTAAATPEASFDSAKAWAKQLLELIAEIIANRRQCEISGCQNAERERREWEELEAQVQRWSEGVAAAKSRGCTDSAPRSRRDIEGDLDVASDFLIAKKVRSCGVSFEPDAAAIAALTEHRLGPLTAAALREPTAYRMSSSDLSSRVARLCAATTAAVSAKLRAAGVAAQEGSSVSPDSIEQSVLPQIVKVGELRWTGSSLGLMLWADAKQRCEALTWNGRRWRLPTFEELQSLALSGSLGFLSSEAQIKIVGCCVWTNTSTDRKALSMSVDDAKKDWLSRRLGQASVLCVS